MILIIVVTVGFVGVTRFGIHQVHPVTLPSLVQHRTLTTVNIPTILLSSPFLLSYRYLLSV